MGPTAAVDAAGLMEEDKEDTKLPGRHPCA